MYKVLHTLAITISSGIHYNRNPLFIRMDHTAHDIETSRNYMVIRRARIPLFEIIISLIFNELTGFLSIC